MFKMTLALAVALYAGFVVWGDPSEAVSSGESVADIPTAMAIVEYERPVILSEAGSEAVVTRAAVSETIVPDAATIAASAPAPSASATDGGSIGVPVLVSLVQPDGSTAVDPSVEVPGADLFKVSGSRVNLRSGPSTANTVVDSLVGGTVTEMLGEEQDGWVQIRDVSSGLTGYMAARFLEPV